MPRLTARHPIRAAAPNSVRKVKVVWKLVRRTVGALAFRRWLWPGWRSSARRLAAAGIALLIIGTVVGRSDQNIAWATSCQPSAAPPDSVPQFASDIVVNPDATTTIRETIQVSIAGGRRLPMLYRDLPARFQDERGHVYSTAVRVIEARVDGESLSYVVRRLPEGTRVYFGSPDDTLAAGEHTFTLAYQVTGNLAFFPDRDVLYWPATGIQWPLPVQCATATVRLPPAVPASGVRATGWIGPESSPLRTVEPTIDRSGIIAYVAAGPLAGDHGLVVSVTWPRGYLREPTRVGEDLPLIGTGQTTTIELFGLLSLVAYAAVAIVRVRRWRIAPRAGPVTRAPDQLSPAGVRYLLTGTADERSLAATILDLAVKGFLVIQEDRGARQAVSSARAVDGEASRQVPATDGGATVSSYELVKTGATAGRLRLAPEEGVLLFELFGHATACPVGPDRFREFRRSANELKRLLEALYEDRYFTNHARYTIPAIVLSLATLGAAALAEVNRASVTLSVGLFWLVVAAALVYLTALLLGSILLSSRFRDARGWLTLGAVALAVYLVPLLGAYVVLSDLTRSRALTVLVLGALGIALAMLRKLLATPTRAGLLARQQVRGLREFLCRTGDGTPFANPEHRWNGAWEAYLPYAVALGVDDSWVWPLVRGTADPNEARTGTGPVRWYEMIGEPTGSGHAGESVSEGLTRSLQRALRGPSARAD